MIIKQDPPNTHWLGDILQRLRSQIVVDNIDLAANLPVGVIRDADATGFRDPLKARCNIDAIAKDIVVVDDDIADVDTWWDQVSYPRYKFERNGSRGL
jgi:hypothetical protein